MGAAKTHIMRWAPQDWRTSRIRTRSAITADPMLRLVYLEILNALWEAGGTLPNDPDFLADQLMLPPAEIARCIPLLTALAEKSTGGGLVLVGECLANARITRDLGEETAFRADQAARGRRGAAAANAAKITATAAEKPASAAKKAGGGPATATKMVDPPPPPPPPAPFPLYPPSRISGVPERGTGAPGASGSSTVVTPDPGTGGNAAEAEAHHALWSRIKAELRRTVDERNFDTWLFPLRLHHVSADDRSLVVSVPGPLFLKFVPENFGPAIRNAMQAAGFSGGMEFELGGAR